MLFPINTISPVQTTPRYPGWCVCRPSGRFDVVAPTRGYLYLIKNRPVGIGDSDQWIIIFNFGGGASDLLYHQCWLPPLPNKLIIYLDVITENFTIEAFLQSLLRSCREDDIRCILDIEIGIEDSLAAESRPETIDLSNESTWNTLIIPRIIEIWERGDYLGIPLRRGQTIFSSANSLDVNLLLISSSTSAPHNPFRKKTFWFDTEVFFKRFFTTGLIHQMPNFPGWDTEEDTAISSAFLSASRDISPFQIRVSSEALPLPAQEATNLISIEGGLQ